jgi:hypothetical protein
LWRESREIPCALSLSFGEGWSVGGEGVGGGGERWWTYHVDVLMIWLKGKTRRRRRRTKPKGKRAAGGTRANGRHGEDMDTEMSTMSCPWGNCCFGRQMDAHTIKRAQDSLNADGHWLDDVSLGSSLGHVKATSESNLTIPPSCSLVAMPFAVRTCDMSCHVTPTPRLGGLNWGYM